ncbi:hypothetical protein [Sphaerisporangium sp. TRM90804]|uniref:hypothetical protein n=1 Tax=Sphaerisporangium sp. TRM90804 TaxID=3031113 RepID=UPI002449C40D|nr:hypothetical protein [Sphaerisporangium sp. TRM90804]MDH2428785.1 hypothetical protein [Sphaerisporangium sp. TRM90804]
MFAAAILLILMILTVALFEVSVNNRPRSPRLGPEPARAEQLDETADPSTA